SQRELLISALQWAVDLARTAERPNLPDHVSGLAAYEAWAKGLEVDADYPADDQKVMETRAMVHCDQVVMLYERHQGAQFLRSMAKTAPEVAAQLTEAADLYDQVGDYSGKVWRWGHWQDPTALKALADRNTRREFASQIREAAATEARAVERLEAALRILTGGA
ncbi:hypothetical protein LLH03_03490, partial [bacterium]|nr:hypothetical protein [bacterium]